MARSQNKTQRRQRRLPDGQYRERCFTCFRPTASCYCDHLSSVENRTEILILQHRRERFHPFNTARMVHQTLKKSRLICERNESFARSELPIGPNSGLLFPGKTARRLDQLPADERPDQLVVIDGTWHHAKTMLRDIRALRSLPQYALAPTTPGRYRIRMEPDVRSLSTVEAVVAALRQLEPATRGVEVMIHAFEAMVEQQLAHPQARYHGVGVQPPRPPSYNVPAAIRKLKNIVVAYGEPAPIPYSKIDGWESLNRRRTASRLPPVCWCAQRIDPLTPLQPAATGNLFWQLVDPGFEIADKFLNYMELTSRDFEHAVTVPTFRRQWNDFLKPEDHLVVFNHRLIGQLKNCGANVGSYDTLCSINYDPEKRFPTIKEFLIGNHHPTTDPQLPGRAGQRLAAAVALTVALASVDTHHRGMMVPHGATLPNKNADQP